MMMRDVLGFLFRQKNKLTVFSIDAELKIYAMPRNTQNIKAIACSIKSPHSHSDKATVSSTLRP